MLFKTVHHIDMTMSSQRYLLTFLLVTNTNASQQIKSSSLLYYQSIVHNELANNKQTITKSINVNNCLVSKENKISERESGRFPEIHFV